MYTEQVFSINMFYKLLCVRISYILSLDRLLSALEYVRLVRHYTICTSITCV